VPTVTLTPSPPEAPSQARMPIQRILILGALSAFGPLSLDMYLPALPSLAQQLGGSPSAAQLTLTACLLGLAGGQVVAGPASDAAGRRPPLLLGLLAYALTSLFCALAPSIGVLIGLRLLQGLGGAAGIVIARATVRDLYGGLDLARFMAWMMAVNGLAPILAPILGGQLLRVTSWRGVFAVLAVIGIALLGAAAFGLRETLPAEQRRPGGIGATLRIFTRLLTDRTFVGYALSAGLALAAMFAYIAGAPFVLENIYHVSPQGFSLIFATNALGVVLSSQISGRLVRRLGARRLLTIGLGVALAGGLLLPVVVVANLGLPGILPALFLVVASVGLISPNAVALALAAHTRDAGSASALLGVLQYIIGAAVAPLVGLWGTATALPMAAIMAALVTGAALVYAWLVRGSPEARSSGPA
jgi:MFS transporter, DHA1 family, multidrug resistance protein